MTDNTDLLSTSSDYQAMQDYWTKVRDIMNGVDAMREGGRKYLPQFPQESDENYDYRRKNSKFTNIYRDIVENLASKPFTKEVRLVGENWPKSLIEVQEDVDGAGNHLSAFAAEFFFDGLNNAIDWLLVDYPKMPANATIADDRRRGARPFWVKINATDMLAVYSAHFEGQEQFVYARIREPQTVFEDGDEVEVMRVRVLVRDPIIDEEMGDIIGYGPARFEVWEQDAEKAEAWTLIDSGPITIGVIALVPFLTGRRKGNTWRVLPPVSDVVDLQIEHYQAETNLKIAKELTAFPMLAGSGVTLPVDKDGKPVVVPIGPSSVVTTPPRDDGGAPGRWEWIEINATSLKFLSEEIDKIEGQMRELGRQPLTAGTSGITQIAAALQSQKASSAVQAWAWLLKDALEKAFVFTAMWLNEAVEPTVFVNTQIAIDLGADKVPDSLLKMRETGDLSQQSLWEQMKERGVLSQEFDAAEEEKRLEGEIPGDDPDVRDAVTPPPREAAQ